MDAGHDDAPCGLASFRDDGVLTEANATLARYVGAEPEVLVGRKFESLLNVPGRIFFQTHLFPLLKMSGRIEEAHISMLDPQGAELPILLNAVRTPAEAGFVSRASVAPMRRRLQYEAEILKGKRALEAAVADKDRANAELRALKDELERRVVDRTAQLSAANAEMEGFTYSIAHDLRAPLRAIASTSRVLIEDAGETLAPEHLALLDRQALNAVKLGRLMDDLLRFSRLSREEFERVPIDLSALAEGVAHEFETAEMAQACRFEVQPGMEADGDPRLVRLVVSNLLHNACKFSPGGGGVWMRAEDLAGERVFSVQDEGVGFDMKYADKLFLPFHRLVADHEFPGTGIGLANVQRIVRRHGGRVWADSRPGEGATFLFTLAPPAAPPD